MTLEMCLWIYFFISFCKKRQYDLFSSTGMTLALPRYALVIKPSEPGWV